MVKILAINYLSDLAECNPENDNLDVHIVLEDGREFTFVVSTPNNISWCMENEGVDYFFGEPVVFVKNLTKENIERVMEKVVAEDGGKWLAVYRQEERERRARALVLIFICSQSFNLLSVGFGRGTTLA